MNYLGCNRLLVRRWDRIASVLLECFHAAAK
jgi:hypothetical protein